MKNNLEKIRKEHGINQEELARALEVSRQTIGSLENGRYNPSIILAFKIAKYFNMSIEEMYDQICIEIGEIQEQLLSGRNVIDIALEKGDDPISGSILGAYVYLDITSDSVFPGTLKNFIDKGCKVAGNRLRDEFVEIVTSIFAELQDKPVSDDEVKKLLTKIANSSPVETIDLFDNKKVVLYSPEEKYIAVETLKKYRSEYAEWYDKVLSSLDELSDDEIRELLDMLK